MYHKNDPMKAYMQDIGALPLITKEKEVELAGRIKKGDERARHELIKANLRLVVKIAHDFKGYGLPLLDLIAEGNIGLMRAAEKFDPTKGAKFSSYSAWWIKQSMRRAISQKSRTIRVPVASAGKINKIKAARVQLAEKLGRPPTDHEIAECLDFTKRTVQGLKLADLKTFSLHDPIQKGEDGSFEDVIADSDASAPDAIIEDSESVHRLRGLIGRLEDREKRILTLRYGLDGSRAKTLEEVSLLIGRTRERVRQIQMNALKKLRAMIEDDCIDNAGHTSHLPDVTQENGEPDSVIEAKNKAMVESLRQQLAFIRQTRKSQTADGEGNLEPSPQAEPLHPNALGVKREELLDIHDEVSSLKVSPRCARLLTAAGIETVAQLAASTSNDLMKIRSFGRKALAEVQAGLDHYYSAMIS